MERGRNMSDINNDNEPIRFGRRTYLDISLILALIFLIGFGLVMIYSTTSYSAMVTYGDKFHFIKTQALATFLGALCMTALTFVNYRVFRMPVFPLVAYFVSVPMVFLVKTSIGRVSHGAARWICIGSLTIQPAEVVKLAMILFFAYYLTKNANKLTNVKEYAKAFAWLGIPCLIVYKVTDNMSSALIIGLIGYVMIYVAGKRPNYMYIIAIAGFVLMVLYLTTGDSFRSERVEVWKHPEDFAMGKGYQTLQALYAIGSGGLFGKGLGNSVQKLGSLPEAQNDMIFSIICEELGIFGAIAIIALYLFILHRIYIIAVNAPNLYGSLLVIGVFTHIGSQMVLNIAVVTNSIPNTGVSLPFLSCGGTSSIFLMFEMGIVLGVSRQIKGFRT